MIKQKIKIKIMQMLKSQRGAMHIWAAVATLVICMVFTGVFEFMSMYTTAKTVRDEAQQALDSVTMETARNIYDQLKQGDIQPVSVDSTVFEEKLCSDLRLEKSGNMYYCVVENTTRYTISEPVLTCTQNNNIYMKATFTLNIPVYFCGRQVTDAEVPVTIQSVYIPK